MFSNQDDRQKPQKSSATKKVSKPINQRSRDKSFPPVIENENKKLSKNKKAQMEAIYKKYLIIRDKFKQDYYVALHSQATQFMIINDLIKQLEKLKFPNQDLHHFKFFRTPSEPLNLSAQDFIAKYRPQVPHDVLFDHYHADKLISVDLYDENIQEGESVYYFLQFNTNICPTKDGRHQDIDEKFRDIINSILHSYQVPREIQEEILTQLVKLAKELNDTNLDKQYNFKIPGPGNLHVICFPKNLVNDKNRSMLYLSRGGGLPLALETDETDQSILEAMQSRDREGLSRFIGRSVMGFPAPTFYPQGRIIASELTPQSGVKIFRINNLPKNFKIKYKACVKKIAARIIENSKSFAKQLAQESASDFNQKNDKELNKTCPDLKEILNNKIKQLKNENTFIWQMLTLLNPTNKTNKIRAIEELISQLPLDGSGSFEDLRPFADDLVDGNTGRIIKEQNPLLFKALTALAIDKNSDLTNETLNGMLRGYQQMNR